MSTILDALKRVEEHLRKTAEQRAADGLPKGLELPVFPDDAPVQTKEATSAEDDEATTVYLSLVDMIERLQDRNQALLEKERVETGNVLAELGQAMAALQGDFARHREALQQETQRRDAEREAVNAAHAAVQSRIDPLNQSHAETEEAIAKLAQAVTRLENDAVRQHDTLLAAIRQQEAPHKPGKAARAAAAPHADSLNQIRTEAQGAAEELARAVSALQGDLARHRETFQEETRNRDAEREAGKTAWTTAESEIDVLRRSNTEVQAAMAELGQAIAAVQQDFARHREALLERMDQVDAQRETQDAARAAAQSEAADLRRLLEETRTSNAELAQATAVLEKDFARHREAFQEEIRQQAAEREAGQGARKAAQAQIDTLGQIQTETKEAVADLAQAVAPLQNDFAQHREAFQEETRKWESAHETESAARAAAQSQSDALRQAHGETEKTVGELLQAVAALQNDFARQRETFQEELRRREAKREVGRAAWATVQSQIGSLKQMLGDRVAAVAGAQDKDPSAAGAAPGAPVGEKLESVPVLDRDEAQRLHANAGAAYAKGEFAEALHLLNIIDASFPDNQSILYNKAECLIFLGRTDEADRLCDYLVNTLKYSPAEDLKSRITG